MSKNWKLYRCFFLMILILIQVKDDAAQTIVNSVTNEPSELDIKENYLEYIAEFPKKIGRLKQEKNWKQIAIELYNLSDCFFQLNRYDDLKYIIQIASPFAKKYN